MIKQGVRERAEFERGVFAQLGFGFAAVLKPLIRRRWMNREEEKLQKLPDVFH